MLSYVRDMIGLFAIQTGAVNRQRGATLIEYALIIAAIGVVVLVGSMALTGNLTGFFDDVGAELTVS